MCGCVLSNAAGEVIVEIQRELQRVPVGVKGVVACRGDLGSPSFDLCAAVFRREPAREGIACAAGRSWQIFGICAVKSNFFSFGNRLPAISVKGHLIHSGRPVGIELIDAAVGGSVGGGLEPHTGTIIWSVIPPRELIPRLLRLCRCFSHVIGRAGDAFQRAQGSLRSSIAGVVGEELYVIAPAGVEGLVSGFPVGAAICAAGYLAAGLVFCGVGGIYLIFLPVIPPLKGVLCGGIRGVVGDVVGRGSGQGGVGGVVGGFIRGCGGIGCWERAAVLALPCGGCGESILIGKRVFLGGPVGVEGLVGGFVVCFCRG